MRVEAHVTESRDSIRRQELADFLRSRRERTSPAEAGLPERPRRRTPGLRREDLADLAGISATWYTRLEQGRDIRASVSVVERLARALRLDAVERTQLFQLALRQAPPISRGPKEKLSPLLQRVLRHLDSMPALVLGRRWDVLGWNLAARALLTDFESIAAEDRNLVWLIFTGPAMRTLFVDWPSRARDVLARFRVDYGRHTGDPQFVELLNRLKRVSLEFAQWWPRHDLMPHTGGRKHYNHPLVGRLVRSMCRSRSEARTMSLRADGPIFQWQVIVNETAVTQHQYVAAALTLSLSLDRERDRKWAGRRNQKSHKLSE